MKYRIQQLKMRLDHDEKTIEKAICAILGTGIEGIASWNIAKKSFDAREKASIRVIYSVDVEMKKPLRRGLAGRDVLPLDDDERYRFPLGEASKATGAQRREVIVVGGGPAGLFCALLLAENGFRPIILERGGDVESRMRSVGLFWDFGILDPDSNMQFGEGGAGTFSDGKLNTSVGDKLCRNRKVIEEFLEAGAPPEIAYINKPHIGTDYLVGVVRNIRKKIENLGGEVRFRSKVTSFEIKDGKIRALWVNGREKIEASMVVLAIGHSARDSFEELSRSSVRMERKPFAIGLRIEHRQAMIQKSQFGASWKNPHLPAADYKLTYQTTKGRGVYSFCMCPGGFVVNSSSEQGMVVCNGMSNFVRDERNANSAIVAAVRTEDFGSDGPLAGMEFQRTWERAAFSAANPDGKGFAMPAQTLKDFLGGRCSSSFGDIAPCSKGATSFADLNACLPAFVAEAIKESVAAFDRKIKGFGHPDAVLSGVETRTSSPIRILRDDRMQSSVAGLFPCGEGCGYAGGIMSAAMDGIKVAEAIAAATLTAGGNNS
ncbi:MAG TPA: NAD(P)/FAD-dependent oxidoreductase [Rectinemataceae bacterium]|nr:NAD(P)/FAD-dependent oxidoreductase [Rectinemataceae bacterium]